MELLGDLSCQVRPNEIEIAVELLNDFANLRHLFITQIALFLFRLLCSSVKFGDAVAFQTLQFFYEDVLRFVESIDLCLLLAQKSLNTKLLQLVSQFQQLLLR